MRDSMVIAATALSLCWTGPALAGEPGWRSRSSAKQRADLARRLAKNKDVFGRVKDDGLARASLRNLVTGRQAALLDLLATRGLPPRLQPMAWEGLSLLGKDRELDLLSELVSGLGPRTPPRAATRLRALARELPAAERPLIELLRRSASASPPLARSCLGALGESGTSACVEVLCAYLTRLPFREAFLSVEPLLAVASRDSAERVALVLSGQLGRRVGEVNRGYAHHVLGELRHPAALNYLFGYVDERLHGQAAVDEEAALPRGCDAGIVAIGKIGTPLAIDFLLDRARGGWTGAQAEVRCIEALAQSRAGAEEAELVESLVEWLGETDDSRVKGALTRSLRALTGERFPASPFVWEAYLARRDTLRESDPDALEDGVWAIGWKRPGSRARGAVSVPTPTRWNDGLARAGEQADASSAAPIEPLPETGWAAGWYAVPALALLLIAGSVLIRVVHERGAGPLDSNARFFELLEQLEDRSGDELDDEPSGAAAAPTRSGWTERVQRLAAGLAPTVSAGGESFGAAPPVDLSQASCPRCHAIGLGQVAELSVAAAGCAGCGGVLIREPDLAFYVALEVDAAAAGGALLDLLRSAAESSEAIRSRQSCPCCLQPFTRLALEGKPVVLLERCAKHGVWFNRKKLPRIAHAAGRHAVAKGLLTAYVEQGLEPGDATFLPTRPAPEESELGAITAIIQQAKLSEPEAIDPEAARHWAEIVAELSADADELYAEFALLPRNERVEVHSRARELVPADVTHGTPSFDDALRVRVVALMRERRSAREAADTQLGAVNHT